MELKASQGLRGMDLKLKKKPGCHRHMHRLYSRHGDENLLTGTPGVHMRHTRLVIGIGTRKTPRKITSGQEPSTLIPHQG